LGSAGRGPLNRAALDKDAIGTTKLRPEALYRRLPRGPHGLAPEEVRHHQRLRIHGAMVEAVARSGYRDASVRQVIGLAGVSRRSFYEQFANKQDCFLETFDVIAKREVTRMRRSYVAAPGGLEDRLRAVFESFAQTLVAEPKASLLVLVDAQTAGAPGTLRLRRATAACEEMLSLGFENSSQATALPAPVVQAITGGLHGAIAARLRSAPLSEAPQLAEQMLDWTLSFQAVDQGALIDALQSNLRRRMREISFAQRRRRTSGGRADEVVDDRERLLRAVLRLSSLHEYQELTSAQIADEARLPLDSFFEHFADRDACFLAALHMIGDELLRITSHPELRGGQWPRAVRRAVREILTLMGERPLYARALIHDAPSARTDTFEWSLGLSRSIAERLLAGAPVPPSDLAADAVAGALWHTIRCQVAGGRIPALGALSDHLSFVILGACIGSRPAAELFAAEPG
jgi:AcrR family transcriptional regulator